ncbi:MAG: hypothetical protein K6U80_05005 [Firmicutes bacterium]|nr:hypothetical protein [Bacillota bacterium]
MGHHHRREQASPKEHDDLNPGQKPVPTSHPFFQENDLAILSVISPFLSPNGQRLISFFLNFEKEDPAGTSQTADIAGILLQTLKNTDPNILQNLIPTFLKVTGNSNAGEILQRFFPKDLREPDPPQPEDS